MFKQRTEPSVVRLDNRRSFIYLEAGSLDQDGHTLVFSSSLGRTSLPLDVLATVLLGPGTSVSAAAMKMAAARGTVLTWVGEEGVRSYSSVVQPGRCDNLLIQIDRFINDRFAVAQQMFAYRFPDRKMKGKTVDELRGEEGAAMKVIYAELAKAHGLEWDGRGNGRVLGKGGDDLNKSISATNACLYGICHAAVLACGMSPAIGFVHHGQNLSFVWDVADLFKEKITLPIAFKVVSERPQNIWTAARKACVVSFHERKLLSLIIPVIMETLGVRDNNEKSA